MSKLRQAGFSVTELVVIGLTVFLVIGAGIFALTKQQDGKDEGATHTDASKQPAPAIETGSDLTKAEQALDQTDIDAAKTDDSQLKAQVDSF